MRLYWNLAYEVAVEFLSTATRLLNAAGLPFQVKVLSDPPEYVRADAGVIYILQRISRGGGIASPVSTRRSPRASALTSRSSPSGWPTGSAWPRTRPRG